MNKTNKTDKTLTKRCRTAAATLAVLATVFAGSAAHAATSQTVGTGTMKYSKAVGGPATLFMRTLTIAPGEVLPWHHHPGIGAYTTVVSGTIIIEDGCGGEVVYTQGDAFLEAPNRVHRGKNPTDANVVTAQTFLVPLGMQTTVVHPQRMCGVPKRVKECLNYGWMNFDYPRYFRNQGDCLRFVLTGK